MSAIFVAVAAGDGVTDELELLGVARVDYVDQYPDAVNAKGDRAGGPLAPRTGGIATVEPADEVQPGIIRGNPRFTRSLCC